MIAHRDTIIRAEAVIGTFSIIGYAKIDENVLIAARVSLFSGKYQHGHPRDRASGGVLIQTYERIHIGKNTRIGRQAIIMTNIGENCTIGASITDRWNLKKYFPQLHGINRGVGGQTLPDLILRFKRDVINLQPRAVVIKFCSTNIRPEMPLSILEECVTIMSDLALQHRIVPIVSTIIPAGKPESHIGDFGEADSLAKFNDWMRQYAAAHSLPLIDFAKVIGDNQGYLPRACSTDPVHVNEQGYQILSDVARSVIDRMMGITGPVPTPNKVAAQ